MRAGSTTIALFKATTLALCCLPLLGMRPAVWVVVLWVLAALVHRVLDKDPRPAPDLRTFLFLAAPFLLMLLDLLRAGDPLTSWHIAERSAILAVAPFVVFVLRAQVDEGLRQRATDVFAFAALALALFANGSIVGLGIRSDTPFAAAYRERFAEVVAIHPPFAAFFFLLGALFLIDRALTTERHRVLRAAVAGVLVLAGTMLASRTPLVAFLAGALVLGWMHLPRRMAMRFSLALGLTLMLVVAAMPSARQRVQEAFHTEIKLPAPGASNSVSERFVVGRCSWELLKEHGVFGLGQTAVQPALDACYAKFNDPRYLDGSFSSHNQLVHWWLSFGVLGALLFVAVFLWPLRLAWNTGDARLAAFLVFVLICCTTENLLARQWGVVPYAFFLSLLSPSLFSGARAARTRSQR